MSRLNAPLRNPDLTSKEWQQFFAKLKIVEGEFIPAPSGLTIGGGVGSVVYEGRYYQIGSLLWISIFISTTGSKTIASTSGITFIPAPRQIARDNICSVQNVRTDVDWGNGSIKKSTNRIFLPTIAAAAGDYVISGWYETTA